MPYERDPLDQVPGPRADAAWATFGMIDDVRPFIADLLARNQPGAIATLIRADGPSPRPIGAQMAVALDGAVCGYLSGGCVEANVALLGQEVARTGAPRIVRFGAGSPFIDVRLPCGGAIELLIEPVRRSDETLHAVVRARGERQPIVRTLALSGLAHVETPTGPTARAGIHETGAFWRRYDPPTRLVILGHDPVALALAQLSGVMGLETALVRASGPEHGPPDISGRYLRRRPAEAFDELGLDAWTAVVTTTHDLSQDHEALMGALPSRAFYVGALGSRRRLAERRERLENEGLAADLINRLRAPVGLDIGAANPFEIALAILAEIVQCARQSDSAIPDSGVQVAARPA